MVGKSIQSWARAALVAFVKVGSLELVDTINFEIQKSAITSY
jgi:hypothetical protein